MGLPEARVEDVANLMPDVKQQLPSVDIDVNPQTVKIVIAGACDGHTQSKD